VNAGKHALPGPRAGKQWRYRINPSSMRRASQQKEKNREKEKETL
jgi:hypothetical protein